MATQLYAKKWLIYASYTLQPKEIRANCGLAGNATDGSWGRKPFAGGTPNIIWDMGTIQNIGSIKFTPYTDGRTYHDYKISVSTDNSTWTDVFGPSEFPTDKTTSNTEAGATQIIKLSAVPTACATGYSSTAITLVYGQTNSCTAQTVTLNANGGTAGAYCAGGTVAENATLSRTACSTGLTTRGYGPGVDEAGDCGRILHAKDDVVYLRSDKKTQPALHVKINGTTLYGNMSTTKAGKVRIKKNGITYTVYDDGM